MEDELLTIAEVAMRLRVDTTTVRRWIVQGVFPAVTLPHAHKRQLYRVRASTLDTLMKGEEGPQQKTGKDVMS